MRNKNYEHTARPLIAGSQTNDEVPQNHYLEEKNEDIANNKYFTKNINLLVPILTVKGSVVRNLALHF